MTSCDCKNHDVRVENFLKEKNHQIACENNEHDGGFINCHKTQASFNHQNLSQHTSRTKLNLNTECNECGDTIPEGQWTYKIQKEENDLVIWERETLDRECFKELIEEDEDINSKQIVTELL